MEPPFPGLVGARLACWTGWRLQQLSTHVRRVRRININDTCEQKRPRLSVEAFLALPPVEMSRFQDLKDLFKRRLLTAARRDLIGQLETTSGYEAEQSRQRKLLDVLLIPEIKLRRADVQQLLVGEEEVPPEQQEEEQEWSLRLDQEEPPQPPHIKEEEEELWSSQEGEQLPGLEEVPVKREEDEEKPQSSQLHHMQTGADEEDRGGPGAARSPAPDPRLQPETEDSSEAQSDDGDKDWKDPDRKPFGCSVCGKAFKHRGNLNTHMRSHTGVKPFSCSLCDKSFTQKAGLDYHLKTHTGERPFSCSVCAKTFRHKAALTYHMATHTGVKPFSCSVCGKRFMATSQLKIHKCVGESLQLHRSQSDKRKKPLSCSECDATFPNNYLLKTHLRMHKGKTLFTCSVCGQKWQFSSHLEIHMRTHTGEKPYSCSVCGKRFSQRGIVTQHMAIHSGVKPFGCSDCGRRFFWQFQIKKHKCLGGSPQQRRTGFNREDRGGPEPARSSGPDRRSHRDTGKTSSPPPATEDSADIDFWKETRQHQSGFTYRRNKKHSAPERYDAGSDDVAKTEPEAGDGGMVDFCRQTRQRQSSVGHLRKEDVPVRETGCNADKDPLECHAMQARRKRRAEQKPCSCLFCGKGFETGGRLTRHVSVHTGEELLCCVVCEESFTLVSELIRHKCAGESLHLRQSQPEEQVTGSRPFRCSRCSKDFGRKHLLQVHMRSHSGEKPYRCSVCGRTFAKREGLSVHMTSHAGEKPFCCSVCNTGLGDSESLVKHMRIHTQQTQFSCSICGKEFAWRRYLTKHMEVHAKGRIYSCSVCDRGFARICELKYHQCVGGRSSQMEENREAEPPSSSSTEQMGTDGEDCGGLAPAQSSGPGTRLQPEEEDSSETEVSEDERTETREPQSGVKSLKHNGVSQSETACNTGRKLLSCSEFLKIHIKNHTGEEEFRGRLSKHREAKQEDPEPPHIKEEQEEVWISQLTFTPFPVKREEDEEKPQSSQLHHMQTGADEEDGGGPGAARSPAPDPEDKTSVSFKTDDSADGDVWKETRERLSGLRPQTHNDPTERVVGCDSGETAVRCSGDKTAESGPESEDSVDSDFWKDNRKPQFELNSQKNAELCENDVRCNTGRKPYSCPECGEGFLHICKMENHMRFHTGERAFFCSVCGQRCLYKSHLKIHMRTHTGEKPFECPVCGKKYAHKASMQSHMVVHTVEKQHTCTVCDRSFAWYTELKYHRCVGGASQGETA